MDEGSKAGRWRSRAVAAAFAILGLVLVWRTVGPARIAVETNPQGARIEAIGARVWTRGWVWPAGDVTLRISAQGYVTREVPVRLAPGTMRARERANLDLDHGYMTVESDPPGANVWLGTQRLDGSTPMQRQTVPNGDHVLRLQLAGYEAIELSIHIEPGAECTLPKVALVHQTGTLQLTAYPAGMTVVVRDAATREIVTRLSPPVTTRLNAGRYLLQGRLPGHLDSDREIVLAPGAPKPVHITLSPQVLWSAPCPSRVPPLLADLDGDGTLDCVMGDGSAAVNGRDGRVLWRATSPSNLPVSLGDIDHDGTPDCVGENAAWSGRDGRLLWSNGDVYGAYNGPAALFDGNGDGEIETLTHGYTVNCSKDLLRAITLPSGKTLWKQPLPDGGGLVAAVATSDLNGDGTQDLLVILAESASAYRLCAVSGRDGATLWSWQEAGYSADEGVFLLHDCDHDAIDDAVFIDPGGTKVDCVSGHDGHLLWTREFAETSVSYLRMEAAPTEALLVLVGDGLSRLSTQTGEVTWSKKGPFASLASTSSLVDFDGDGQGDLLGADEEGRTRVVSLVDDAVLWTDMAAPQTASWAIPADLDGDGRVDCVLADHGRLEACRTDRPALLWKTAPGSWGQPFVMQQDSDLDGTRDLFCWEGTFGVVSGHDGAVLWKADRAGETVPVLDPDGAEPPSVLASEKDELASLSGISGAVQWKVMLPGTAGHRVLGIGDLHEHAGPEALLLAYRDELPVLFLVSCRDGCLLWERAPWESEPFTMNVRCCRAVIAHSDKGASRCFVVLASDEWGSGRMEKTLGAELFCLGGADGAPLWNQRVSERARIADVGLDADADGAEEVVLISGQLLVLSGRDGHLLWRTHSAKYKFTGGEEVTKLDANGDGVPDLVVVAGGLGIEALSGKDGALLWSSTCGCGPASLAEADMNDDGVKDFVIAGYVKGSGKPRWVNAISGKDGVVLWSHCMDEVFTHAPAVGDMDGDPVPDCIVSLDDGRLVALSGRTGNERWTARTDGELAARPSLADLDGDGAQDCVIALKGGSVAAFSGRNGRLLFSFTMESDPGEGPQFADVTGDGVPECIVGDGRSLYALSARTPAPKGEWKAPPPGPFQVAAQLSRLAGEGPGSVEEVARRVVAEERDPWAQAVAWNALGVTWTQHERFDQAVAAFSQARARHLWSPEGAVYEILSALRWAECSPGRLEEADAVFLHELRVSPDRVFDAMVQSRQDWKGERTLRELGGLVRSADLHESSMAVRCLLMVLPMRDGTRPLMPDQPSSEDAVGRRWRMVPFFQLEQSRLLPRVGTCGGSQARWLGYLALFADAMGEKARFRALRSAYQEEEHGPASLGVFLEEAAERNKE